MFSLYKATTKKKMSRNMKEELINEVNPRTDKIKIKGIRQTKAKSMVIKFETLSNLEKFKDHLKLESGKEDRIK